MTSPIRTIALKEIREVVRDGRLRLLGALVLILGIAALTFGAQQTLEAQAAREDAQSRASKQWRGQGKKNPHVAAHYGTYVFAPATVVTAIDPGVSAYLGRSLKMEAHKRNLADNARAADAGAGAQLGGFSVATILLQLVPLLIIALGYGIWSRERERGTLRQLLSTGVQRGALFWGKCLGLMSLVAGLMIPATVVVVVVLWALGSATTDTFARLALLICAYGLYFSIFGALTVYVSAVARSSRGALVMMVALWGIFCLIVPRIASESATVVEPLISRADLARDVERSLETGIDGKAERETAVDAILRDILADAGFADAGLMLDPVISRGAELQAEAQWEDMVFDHHVEALGDATQRQEDWVSVFGWVSPFVAMRTLSAGLSGTDYAHHRHFTQYAESWRKSFVRMLNVAFAEGSGAEGWAYKAGPEVWEKAPPFDYQSPSLGFALSAHWASVLCLFAWLMVAVTLAWRSAFRVTVV